SVKAKQPGRAVTHGMGSTTFRHPEYTAFQGLRQRCTNPKSNVYHRYGGRGIECRFKTFEEFFDHVGRRPSSDHSIDRSENNGHYEAGNVRWATQAEQMRNYAGNRFISAFGKTRTLSEWARESKVHIMTLRYRIVIAGWPPEVALTAPRAVQNKRG